MRGRSLKLLVSVAGLVAMGLGELGASAKEPLQTMEKLFIYGNLVKVREQDIVVAPPRGILNVLPAGMTMEKFSAQLKTQDPLRYKAFIEEQARIKEDGGYSIPCDPLLLVAAGADLKRLPIGKPILVLLDAKRGSPPPAKGVYLFESLEKMLASPIGEKYNLKKLYEKNLFLVYSHTEIKPAKGSGGDLMGTPKARERNK